MSVWVRANRQKRLHESSAALGGGGSDGLGGLGVGGSALSVARAWLSGRDSPLAEGRSTMRRPWQCLVPAASVAVAA